MGIQFCHTVMQNAYSAKSTIKLAITLFALVFLSTIIVYRDPGRVMVDGPQSAQIWSSTSSSLLRGRPSEQHRRHRGLFQTSQYDAQIFLELQYVTDNVAAEMETLDRQNPTIAHFCRAVQQQVGDLMDRKTRSIISVFGSVSSQFSSFFYHLLFPFLARSLD